MRKKKSYCTMTSLDGKTRFCRNEAIYVLTCKVFHPNSGRITKQKWKICKAHYPWFLDQETKFYCYYFRTGKRAPVIEWTVPKPLVEGLI